MTTVRQSIMALYEESRKSAVDGVPMMAVIDSAPVAGEFPVLPADAPQAAIIARFDELRRLAEAEIGAETGAETETGDIETGDIETGDIETGDMALDMAFGTDIARPEPASSVMEAGTDDAGRARAAAEPAWASQDPLGDMAGSMPLPEEPPAPASTPASGDGADLEIGDIQELVRQAWEDEAGIGQATTSGAPQVPADIESAMEEIAAAVVQSGDGAAPVDIEAMKTEIIAAMRQELKAMLDEDLTRAVRAAVAEAVGEAVAGALATMPRDTGTPKTAETGSDAAPAVKPKAKAAAKKAPAARKASAKKAAAKNAAPRKAGVVKKLRADPTPDPDEV